MGLHFADDFIDMLSETMPRSKKTPGKVPKAPSKYLQTAKDKKKQNKTKQKLAKMTTKNKTYQDTKGCEGQIKESQRTRC